MKQASEQLQATDKTRQRLLEAAGKCFAEMGYRGASVRDICAKAGANVAAVKYHFGDKERLYSEVLRYAHVCAIDKYPPDMGLSSRTPATQRLHAFVKSFLLRILDEGRPAWHGKIMSREMAEPTAAMDELVERQIRPQFSCLFGLVKELVGPRVSEATIRHCCHSVVGQCLFYHFGRPVAERLSGERFGMKDVDTLAEHITRVSLAGLRAVASGAARKGGRR